MLFKFYELPCLLNLDNMESIKKIKANITKGKRKRFSNFNLDIKGLSFSKNDFNLSNYRELFLPKMRPNYL